MSEFLTYELVDGTAVIRMDDGKANALGHGMLDALNGALDQADEDGAKAILLAGRPGRFSAGFDLKVMTAGVEPLIGLLSKGAEFYLRLYMSPKPVVLACTGHALAGGALLLLCADARIGVEGEFKIGLNEVAIGMRLPMLGVEMVRDRLTVNAWTEALLGAHMYDPQSAAKVGYLDQVVPAEYLEKAALKTAAGMGELLDAKAFAGTKRLLRAGTVARIRASFQADMDALRNGE